MQRREFITLVGGAAAWPVAARSQNGGKTFRISVFPALAPQILASFAAELQRRGWTQGRDVIVEEIRADMREGAQPVLANKPDVVVTISTAHTLAVQRLTKTTPIVMMTSGYPVEAGLAESLARPGKNVTGNALYAATGVWGKILQLLHEAKPSIERVGVLWTYARPAFPTEEVEPCFAELNKAARTLGLMLHIVEGWRFNFSPLLSEIGAANPDGLVLTSFLLPDQMKNIAQFAIDKGLPAVTDYDWAQVGISPLPLLSYGPQLPELAMRAAATVDKILRGAKPDDLPIQNPDKFETVVNLKTAQAIGISLPERFLMLADKVSE